MAHARPIPSVAPVTTMGPISADVSGAEGCASLMVLTSCTVSPSERTPPGYPNPSPCGGSSLGPGARTSQITFLAARGHRAEEDERVYRQVLERHRDDVAC